jgi:hypothetical protein
MKTLFALLLLLGPLTSVFAQSRKIENARVIIQDQDNRRNDDRRYDDRRYNDRRNDSYAMTGRERDQLIQRIRDDFRWKVRNVENSRYMRPAEKRRQIRALENEKDYKIRQVNERYFESRNRYSDRSQRW